MPRQPTPATPFRERGRCAPVERRKDFEGENERRLAILAGLRCPRCGGSVSFDGRSLRCTRAGCLLSWQTAEYAEDEIYCGITR